MNDLHPDIKFALSAAYDNGARAFRDSVVRMIQIMRRNKGDFVDLRAFVKFLEAINFDEIARECEAKLREANESTEGSVQDTKEST